MRALRWAVVLLGAVACAGSGTASRPASEPGSPEASRAPRGPGSTASPPAALLPEIAAARYTTDPGAGGIAGGEAAAAVAREIANALRARGDDPRPDETLAALSRWYLGEVVAGRGPGSTQSKQAAERLGFAGALEGGVVFPLRGPEAGVWKQALADVARNLPITRYGLYLAGDGETAAVAFAGVELRLEPFDRHFKPGQPLRLRGEIAPRFARTQVYLTAPDGTVGKTDLPGRRLDVSLPLPAPGVYGIEVMGDGPSGPVVLSNVHIYVGVPEPDPRATGDAESLDGADAAERMLVLLNRARAAAGRPPLASDPELRAVALVHTGDMVSGHFFGHVSPTTGTVGDRMKRAGVSATVIGENVTQGFSAESAHQVLMDSPGHRAGMLDARFTHVGIAVLPTNSQPPLVATLVFARRPPPPARLKVAEVTAAIATLRRDKKVPAAAADRGLTAAAEAGMEAFKSGKATTPEAAMDAANAALVKLAARAGASREGGCTQWLEILELADLNGSPLLARPGVKRIGVAVLPRTTGNPPPLAVLVMTQGSGCQ